MSDGNDDFDPVVTDVLGTLAEQLAPRHISKWDRMTSIAIVLLLVVGTGFSITGFTLTQLHNSCQNTATQRLRDANNSDRQAQDELDKHYQDFIDSLSATPPPDIQTRRRIYEQEKTNYAQFKQVRAQNELIRAATTRRC